MIFVVDGGDGFTGQLFSCGHYHFSLTLAMLYGVNVGLSYSVSDVFF